MSHDLATLFFIGLLYLGILFLLANATDRGRLPASWVRHPLTYTLSIGVYASSWTYYGSVGFAHSGGLQFLTIYLGVTLTFVLTPILLKPILRLTRDYQLSSLPDLFAFRYRSQTAGALATLFMLLGTLPYIALQIRAVTESLRILSDEVPPNIIALVFCVTLILFAMLFGARHISPREKHLGLVAAIAFESLIKLIVLLLIGLFAFFDILGGFAGLQQHLAENPELIEKLYQPIGQDPWVTLIFLSFGAAFLLPRQFHMMFTENLDPKALRTASWSFPAFLLLLNLPIPIILWAGQSLQLGMSPDYFVLGVTVVDGPSWLSVLAFIGGLSAASAMVIVTSLALASMSLNNLLLPASYPDPEMNLYKWILWGKRLLIGLIIMAGYAVYITLKHTQGLVQLGLVSFVAVIQFLPGIIGLLYWRRATRSGFIMGLLGGAIIWAITLLGPLLHTSDILLVEIPMDRWLADSGMSQWTFATLCSLTVNSVLFVVFSLATRQSQREQEAASACCAESLVPLDGVVAAASPQEFRAGLAETLGKDMADREVTQALYDLNLRDDEHRSTELRRLRERIERNLSGLLGPQLAHMIVNRRIMIDPQAKTALADSVQYVEERLEASRSELRGLNVELDNLRRLHRQILQDLPLGVCATDDQGKIVLWNLSLELMTNIRGRDISGSQLKNLPEPWNGLFSGFARVSDEHIHRMELWVGKRPRWYNLHKARYADPVLHNNQTTPAPGMVMIIEDLTDLSTLEAELTHSDRLASIGRLAAGVAHEIGNPVTGIASLAQNLRDENNPQEIRSSVDDILSQTKRIANILQTLQSFSRGGQYREKPETFALCDVVHESVHLLELTHKHNRIAFAATCPKDIRLTGSRQQISQVLVNLLKNAADASPDDEQVILSAHGDGHYAYISIEDHGAGIPETLHETIFEPFFTTKPTGQGTGLGLALAYRIIEDHNGNLRIETPNQGGTRMVVALPIEHS